MCRAIVVIILRPLSAREQGVVLIARDRKGLKASASPIYIKGLTRPRHPSPKTVTGTPKKIQCKIYDNTNGI